MELVREIHLYPWRRIVGTVCFIVPVVTSLYFLPDWHSPRADAFIAIWLETTLFMSALSLSLYRAVVTTRERPVENTFQMVAMVAPSFLFRTSDGVDANLGRSVGALLFADRSVLWSVGVIVVTLGFIVAGRLKRAARHR